MFKQAACAALVAIAGLALVEQAQGALEITVPHVELQPSLAGQIVTLQVTGGDLVAGFNLYAQIGENGTTALTPVFESMSAGAMWQGKSTTLIGGAVDGAERYMTASVVLNEPGDTAGAMGTLLELAISTEGIGSGTFSLLLSGTDIGQDSSFIAAGGADIPAIINNGSITVAVPEPSGLAALGLVGFALMKRRVRPAQR